MRPGTLRRGVAAGGGLVDLTDAAAILGVSRQALDQRVRRAAKRNWLGLEEPIAFLSPDPVRPSGPVWTREQMLAQREVDAAQGYRTEL